MTAVRSWADEGFLPHRRITGLSKRTFDKADLDQPDVRARAAEWQRLYGTPPELTGLLPLREIARQLGVAEHSLRKLILAGGLRVAHDAGPGSAGGKYFDPADVAAVPGTWSAAHAIGLLSITDVVKQTRKSAYEVRLAADAGLLAARSHGRSWRRFEPSAVAAWKQAGCPTR